LIECKAGNFSKTEMLKQIKRYKHDDENVAAIIIVTPAPLRHFSLGGTPVYTDGQDALAAAFDFLAGLALDDLGSLYVSDRANRRVGRVLAGPPALAVPPVSLNLPARSGGARVTQSLFISAGVSAVSNAGANAVTGMDYELRLPPSSPWL